jgi:hypothetical protein
MDHHPRYSKKHTFFSYVGVRVQLYLLFHNLFFLFLLLFYECFFTGSNLQIQWKERRCRATCLSRSKQCIPYVALQPDSCLELFLIFLNFFYISFYLFNSFLTFYPAIIPFMHWWPLVCFCCLLQSKNVRFLRLTLHREFKLPSDNWSCFGNILYNFFLFHFCSGFNLLLTVHISDFSSWKSLFTYGT